MVLSWKYLAGITGQYEIGMGLEGTPLLLIPYCTISLSSLSKWGHPVTLSWQKQWPYSSLPVLCVLPALSLLPAAGAEAELPCAVQVAVGWMLVMARKTKHEDMMRPTIDSSGTGSCQINVALTVPLGTFHTITKTILQLAATERRTFPTSEAYLGPAFPSSFPSFQDEDWTLLAETYSLLRIGLFCCLALWASLLKGQTSNSAVTKEAAAAEKR